MASFGESNRERKERLRKLALEVIDLSSDPYFMRNHLGGYEVCCEGGEGACLRRAGRQAHPLQMPPLSFSLSFSYSFLSSLPTHQCKLCLTLHTNEGSYLAHTQAKKHQENL